MRNRIKRQPFHPFLHIHVRHSPWNLATLEQPVIRQRLDRTRTSPCRGQHRMGRTLARNPIPPSCWAVGLGSYPHPKLHGVERHDLQISTPQSATLEVQMLRFPQVGLTKGGVWKRFYTKSQPDFGQESTSATPKTVGNGKDLCVATATDSSTPKENTVQSTDSRTTSPHTRHRQWYATNATTEDAATPTISKAEPKPTT